MPPSSASQRKYSSCRRPADGSVSRKGGLGRSPGVEAPFFGIAVHVEQSPAFRALFAYFMRAITAVAGMPEVVAFHAEFALRAAAAGVFPLASKPVNKTGGDAACLGLLRVDPGRTIPCQLTPSTGKNGEPVTRLGLRSSTPSIALVTVTADPGRG